MSGLTRSDLYARSLKVHNKSGNILEMDLLGDLNINTKNMHTDVKEDIELKAKTNLSLNTINGNLETKSENGNIILRNGTYSDINSLDYNYLDTNVDETSYSYFDNSQIIKPYTTKESVVALRDESLLIESLNPSKRLTLYSNNGINSVAHGNITNISDNNYIVQANNKINLTSLGFITLNSERLIGTIEEDISLFSSTGNIILGGTGVDNNGINVNSNSNNNFVSIGKNGDAERNVDIDLTKSSTTNTRKNGIVINNSTNAKTTDNYLINPDISLKNSEVTTNFGIGPENNDINLRVLAKKINIGNLTYLKPLNNFNFLNSDVGIEINWNDTNFLKDTILDIEDNETHGKIARISFYNSSQVTAFNIQVGYINRNNFSYLKTTTSSPLYLGTNNSNIISITEQGNIGINTNVPNANLNVVNTFGDLFNNKVNTTKKYFNSKSVQLQNGNIAVISNASYTSSIFGTSQTLYSLEGFIYNDLNTLIYNFIIKEDSILEIVFGLDNLKGDDDRIVVSYIWQQDFYGIEKTGETKIFTNTGNKVQLGDYVESYFSTGIPSEDNLFITEHNPNFRLDKEAKQYTGYLWKDANSNSKYFYDFVNVKSFSFPDIELNGYIVFYSFNEVGDVSNVITQSTYAKIYKNNSYTPLNIQRYTHTEASDNVALWQGNDIELFNSSLDNDKVWCVNSYFNDIEINTQNNSFIITSNLRFGYYTGSKFGFYDEDVSNYSTTLNNSYNFSLMQQIKLEENGVNYLLSSINFGSNYFLPIKVDVGGIHDGENPSSYQEYKITGIRIKLVKTNETTSTKDYILAYYKKNINGTRSNAYLKRLTLKSDFSVQLNQISTELDNVTITDSDTNILIEDVPSVDSKSEGEIVVSWINGTNIKYFEKNIDESNPIAEFLNSTTPNNYEKNYILCLKNLLGEYKETIVSFNNNNSADEGNYESITLKKILSTFNIFGIKNSNLELNITSDGEFNFTSNKKINFNDTLQIDKASSTITMKKNLILSGLSSAPTSSTPGIEGQINYNGSNLYLYLGGSWKKINLLSL